MFHLFLCQNGRVYAKTRKERFTRSLVNLSTRQLVNLPTGKLVNWLTRQLLSLSTV